MICFALNLKFTKAIEFHREMNGRNTSGNTLNRAFFFQVANCSEWQLAILKIIFYALSFTPEIFTAAILWENA